MKTALFLGLIVGLTFVTGCAQSQHGKVSNGGAVYEFTHASPDGSLCSLRITSARNVTGGDVKIGPNCELETSAQDAGGAIDALQQISEIAAQVIP